MNKKGYIQETLRIEQALENLHRQTGFTAEWRPHDHPFDNGLDGTLMINLSGEQLELDTEIKKEVRPHQVKMIAQKVGRTRPLLVVAENIFPKAKEWMRANNIAYLDTAGNFFIRNDGIWIWIEGNKLPKVERETPNRAFTQTGLKVLFMLLTDKQAIDMPYRDIAMRANVALGNIPLVIRGLKELGFLIKLDQKRYKLINKKELFNRWMAGYQETLRPKLAIGTFRTTERSTDWRQYGVVDGDCWGGEAAADVMTGQLEPEKLILYTKANKKELLKRYRLIPDPNGNIEALQRFWIPREEDHIGKHVHPMLVYADLMLTQDPRNMEIAELIYEKYLKAALGE